MVFISGKYLRDSIESFSLSFFYISLILSLRFVIILRNLLQLKLACITHTQRALHFNDYSLFLLSLSLSCTRFLFPSALVFSEKRLGAVCCIHYEPLSQAGDKKRRCYGAGHEAAFMRFALVTNAPYLMPAHVLLMLLRPRWLPLPLLPALPRQWQLLQLLFALASFSALCVLCAFLSLLFVCFSVSFHVCPAFATPPASLPLSLQLSLFRILFLKMQFSLKFIAIFLRFSLTRRLH